MQKVIETLKNTLISRGFSVRKEFVTKNGLEREALIVNGGGDVSAVMYLDDLVERLECQSIAEIAEYVVNHLRKVRPENFGDLTDWNFVKMKLRVCVAPRKPRPDALSEEFCDLQKYVRIVLSENASAIVTSNHCTMWGVDGKEVFRIAEENTLNNAMVDDLMAVVFGINPSTYRAFDYGIMAVLATNPELNHGAGVICCTEFLRYVAEKMESDLLIIPSSIHEVIIFKYTDDAGMSDFIKQVNENEVRPSEVLSDHPYAYIRSINKVVMV